MSINIKETSWYELMVYKFTLLIIIKNSQNKVSQATIIWN